MHRKAKPGRVSPVIRTWVGRRKGKRDRRPCKIVNLVGGRGVHAGALRSFEVRVTDLVAVAKVVKRGLETQSSDRAIY